jgi:hypothetical protein
MGVGAEITLLFFVNGKIVAGMLVALFDVYSPSWCRAGAKHALI